MVEVTRLRFILIRFLASSTCLTFVQRLNPPLSMLSSDVNLKINLYFKGCIAEVAGEGRLTPMFLGHVLIQATFLGKA